MRKFICILAALTAITALRAQVPDCPLDTINGEEVYRYTVEKSIGLYRIGVNFDVPQSEIIRMNPQLKERGLHFGETLYIPTGRKVEPKPVVQTVIKHDTIVIVDTIRIPAETVAPAIAHKDTPHTDTLRVDSMRADSVSIAVADTILTLDSLRTDSAVADTRRVIELALMLPFESQQTKRSANAERIMEFYQGALLALNNAQNDSTLYRLRVYDTERSDRRVAALCDTLCHELDSVRGIIGLAYPVQIERMSEWCTAHNVPLLLPFSDDINLTGKPQLMQFNSTDAQEAEAITQWINAHEAPVHCVTVDAREAEVAGCIRTLRNQMRKDTIACTTVTIRDVLSDSLSLALAADKQNLIILHSDKFNRVRTMIPHIEQCASRGYDIVLLSQYSWQREDIHLPQIYTSVFTADADVAAYDALWSKYFTNEHVSDIPRYDLLGYDLMNAMLRRLRNEQQSNGLQADILWTRTGEEDGWQNANVRVIER